jgi:hypothetical protein
LVTLSLVSLICVVVIIVGIHAIRSDRPGTLPSSDYTRDQFYLWFTSKRAFRDSTLSPRTVLTPDAKGWTARTEITIETLDADAHGTIRVIIPDSANKPCFGVDLQGRGQPCDELQPPVHSTITFLPDAPREHGDEYGLSLNARDFGPAVKGLVDAPPALLGTFVMEYSLPNDDFAYKLGTGEQLLVFDVGVAPIGPQHPMAPTTWRTYHRAYDNPAIARLNTQDQNYAVGVELPAGGRVFDNTFPDATYATLKMRSWAARLTTVHVEAQTVNEDSRSRVEDEKGLMFAMIGVVIGASFGALLTWLLRRPEPGVGSAERRDESRG